MRHHLERLEVHASHACDLTCESCSHYSNHGHSGLLDLDDARAWFSSWGARLAPATFSVMGGEPTLHPRLPDLVAIATDHFDHVEVVSNGARLARHPGLGPALATARGRRRLALSEHRDDPAVRGPFEAGLALARAWAIADPRLELDVRRYFPPSGEHNFSGGRWTRRYRGYGPTMRPIASGNPAASWATCPARHCAQLHEGHLWKCPALAYLPMQASKFPELAGPFALGLEYRALGPGASDEDLAAFLRRGPEAQCGQCPAPPEPFRPASPLVPARELLRGVRP